MEDIKLDKSRLNVLVAYAQNNLVIGKDKDLPWKRKLKADHAFINLITTKYKTAVIMGRCTFESIGRKLPGRLNIVLTTKKIHDVECYTNLEDAVSYCRKNDYYIVIFGGTNVYKKALDYDCKLFCTVIDNNFEGDTYFPSFNYPIENITIAVNDFLLENGVKKTWEYCDNKFFENGIQYGFYTNK